MTTVTDVNLDELLPKNKQQEKAKQRVEAAIRQVQRFTGRRQAITLLRPAEYKVLEKLAREYFPCAKEFELYLLGSKLEPTY